MTSRLGLNGLLAGRASMPIMARLGLSCPPPQARAITSPSVPRVLSPSLWRSLLPSHRRAHPVNDTEKIPWLSRPWNPATFFIVMALVIGSNAINILALKRHTLNYTRKTEAKLALLREIIDRVQQGEDVDVEAVLGTGQPESEAEWAAVMREVEQGTYNGSLASKSKARAAKAEHASLQEHEGSNDQVNALASKGTPEAKTKSAPEFY